MNLFEFTELKTEYKRHDNKGLKLRHRIKDKFIDTLNNESDEKTFLKQCENIAYLYKSKNSDYIDDLNKFDEIYDTFINASETDLFSSNFNDNTTIYPWTGSKSNRKDINTKITEKVLKYNDNIDTSLDLFMGAGNLTLDNLYLYDKYNIKVIMNDCVKLLTSTFINIKNDSRGIIKEICKILFYIKNEFGTIELTKEEDIIKLENYVYDIINKNIKDDLFDVRTSALFYISQHQNFGGLFDFDIDKNIFKVKFRKEKDYHIFSRYSNMINKLRFYNYALNILDIEILTSDYNDIINKFNSKNVYLLCDSPYADYKSEVLKSGGANYTTTRTEKDFGNDFNQDRLIDYIKNHDGSFQYWNNHHYRIEEQKEKFYIYKKLESDYRINKTDKIEVVMCENILNIEDIIDEDLFLEFLNEYDVDERVREKDLFVFCELFEKHNVHIPDYAKDFYENIYLVYKINKEEDEKFFNENVFY